MDLNFERKAQRFDPGVNLLWSVGGSVVQNQVKAFDALTPDARKEEEEESLEVGEFLTVKTLCQRFASRNQECCKKLEGAFSSVAIGDFHRGVWYSWEEVTLSFSCLNGCFLISTNDDMSSLGQRLCLRIEVKNGFGSLYKVRVSRFLPRTMLPGLDLVFS